MTYQSSMADDGRRGMILLVVLWAVSLMTVIVVALGAFAQKGLSAAAVEASRLRSELALESGLALGAATILATTAEERVFFNGAAIAADIGGGRRLEIRISDAAGSIDINRADAALLEALALRLEFSKEEAEAFQTQVLSLREAVAGEGSNRNSSLRTVPSPVDQVQRGSESGETSGEESAPAPAFFAEAQLRGIEGIGAAADKLLPHITLYSSSGKVNPMAASDVVLDAIPGLKAADRQALASAAKRRQWRTPDIGAILETTEKYLAIGEPRVFEINLTITAGTGLIPGSSRTATIVLDEEGLAPYRVLAWSW